MTIASPVARVSYVGTGSAGPFAIPFRFFSFDDLLVIVTTVDGVDVELTADDYTGTGERNASGTITLNDVLATGERLTILRAPANVQGASFRNQGAYFGSAHEDALDALAMQIQSIKDHVERAVALPASYDPADRQMEIAPETGKVLSWASPTQLTNVLLDGGEIAIPGQGRQVDSLSAYLANNARFAIADYYLADDGGTMDSAIARAVAALNTAGGGTLVIGPGDHATAARIDMDLPTGSVIQWEGRIVSSVTADSAVRIGSTVTTRFSYSVIGGIHVVRSALDPSGSSVGVEIRNVVKSMIHVRAVTGFSYGLRCNGTHFNGGCTYNRFLIDELTDNTVNLHLAASGAGFTNENNFFGGSFGHSSAFPSAVPSKNVQIDNHTNPLNNNRFYSPSWEDNSTLAMAADIDGQFTLIVHPRLENPALGTAYLIHFGTHSQECRIIGGGAGLNLSDIDDHGTANSYETRDGIVYRSFVADTDDPIMQVQSVVSGQARCYVALDSSAVARWWVTGDGKMFSNQHGYFQTGIRWTTSDGSNTDRGLYTGVGSPEGVQSANPGSMYMNLSGGANTTLYVKESGGGNVGWVAK
jgi:hypothetical protein